MNCGPWRGLPRLPRGDGLRARPPTPSAPFPRAGHSPSGILLLRHSGARPGARDPLRVEGGTPPAGRAPTPVPHRLPGQGRDQATGPSRRNAGSGSRRPCPPHPPRAGRAPPVVGAGGYAEQAVCRSRWLRETDSDARRSAESPRPGHTVGGSVVVGVNPRRCHPSCGSGHSSATSRSLRAAAEAPDSHASSRSLKSEQSGAGMSETESAASRRMAAR